ncbi:MAG TPA: hypothetical protein VGB17_03890 [Pyrinomonadaceae bacterium]|jgi:uncharacterized membrane protein YhdT
MLIAPLLMLLQTETRATPPGYFAPVALFLLIAGGIGWLVAAVLGFARAPAFGASTRWFSLAAVCLVIYHLQFILLGVVAMLSVSQSETDLGMMLSVGAFWNLFVVLASVCAIMGFVRLTSPR